MGSSTRGAIARQYLLPYGYKLIQDGRRVYIRIRKDSTLLKESIASINPLRSHSDSLFSPDASPILCSFVLAFSRVSVCGSHIYANRVNASIYLCAWQEVYIRLGIRVCVGNRQSSKPIYIAAVCLFLAENQSAAKEWLSNFYYFISITHSERNAQHRTEIETRK